jgi:outer membrane protein TolC
MQINRVVFTIAIIASTLINSLAQEIKYFSLMEAIDFAMENNYEIINAEKDVEAAKQRILETTAIGLPQINAFVDYNNNIALPTSLIPGDFFGQPGEEVEIQFGTKYNATLHASATQLIFSGEYIVGLKAARTFLERTSIDFFKNKVAIRQKIADSYCDVLSVEEGLIIIDTTLKVTQKLAEETRLVYEVGFAEDIDVDQLDLLVADLEASKIYFENHLNITHAFLKFYLGLGDNDSIILTDNIEYLIEERDNSPLIAKTFNFSENVDYQFINKQKELSLLQVKLEKSRYLPSLSASLNYQTQAQRNQWDFFNPEGKWFSSSAFGIAMQVPVFSSGQRKAKVKQAEIAVDKVEVQEKQLITTLNLQYKTAINEYMNAYRVYLNKGKSRKTSANIYQKTTRKFTQGMASSLDILNTQNQYLSIENEYINAARTLLKAGAELEKILTKSESY